ncbi:MAG: 50S ribosomal protein L18 [Bacteroidales bacterium]|jgi:large subunit ribosomal protein L18|nr:50S ribosomal protein L18 [Bacteroidales bacterium]
MALTKSERRLRIKRRIRKKISGTTAIPRMSVFRSNKQIYVQIVDDATNKTIVSASSKDKALVGKEGNKSAQAALVGELVASKAKEAGVTNVVFDRNGYLYHGRIKSLADGARKGGLNL